MESTSLVQEGLSLMAFGMGFVFVFLTLLVMATTLMSRLVTRFVPVPVKEEKLSRGSPVGGKDEELIAVISAAVQRYRQRRRR